MPGRERRAFGYGFILVGRGFGDGRDVFRVCYAGNRQVNIVFRATRYQERIF